MTLVTTASYSQNPNRFYQRALNAMNRFLERRAEYARKKATYVALSRLSDKELHDIGITRGDIGNIARQS